MDVTASSTVFDTVVFVLLVGAAVGVIAGADARSGPGDDRVAEETGDVLATSTTEVTHTYVVSGPSASPLDGEQTSSVTRVTRGTYAELLAAAAVADPSLAGRPLLDTGETFRSASREAAEQVLHTRGANVQVAVRWRPYPDSTLGSSFTVGDVAPSDADVSVATVTAVSGLANVSAAARRAARTRGYGGVATVTARSVVEGLFPEAAMRAALYSEGPDRTLTLHRYERASAALGVETAALLDEKRVGTANRRLTDALAERLRPELRREFQSPRAAARAVRTHRVRIVVRTWSP